jgi:hypothetical protein
MPPRSHSHDAGSFQRCSGKASCGYQWTWSGKSTCFGCGKHLWAGVQPANPRAPTGVWAQTPTDRPDRKKHDNKQQAPASTMECMQSALAMLQKAPGEDEAIDILAQSLKTKLEAAKQAKFDNKPLWQQCQHAQSNLDKKQKALETAKAKQIKFQSDIESLQKQMLDTDRWIAELSVEVCKLEAECTANKIDDKAIKFADIASIEKQWAALPEALLIDDKWQSGTEAFKKALYSLQELAVQAIALAAPVPGEASGPGKGEAAAAMEQDHEGWQDWLNQALSSKGLAASPEEEALLAKIKQRAQDDYEHRDKKAKKG